MKTLQESITRRDFLRGAAYVTAAATVGIPAIYGDTPKPVTEAKVVLVRNKNVIDAKGKLNAKIVMEMLDLGVTELFGEKKAIDAWQKIVKPDDIVGIKSNVWGPLPTPKAVEEAIKTNLITVGVPAKNIDISDRGVLHSKIFKTATALINVRPLRSHHWSGIGGLIKNYIMFVPRPQDYHDNSCADLAKLWQLPIVKGKTRLNVLLMLTPQFHGIGPHHFDPQYTWPYKGILVGTDPVAVDSVGIRILTARRNDYFGENRPLKPPAHHVLFADIKHKLGTSDPEKIELVKLGWQENALI